MLLALLILSLIIVIFLITILIFLIAKNKSNDFDGNFLIEKLNSLGQEIARSIQEQVKLLSDLLSQNQKNSSESQRQVLQGLQERFTSLQTTSEQKLDLMRKAVAESLKEIQNSNEKKLSDIQTTVDEKLQKSLDEKFANSFKQVSDRLEQVYKGLGEMQSIASSVGDLKKVLANVKTRGNLGEIQLANIFEEIMIPSQYETQFRINPEKNDFVDFAVKMPGENSDNPVYLPIDSKFPGDTYGALQDAYENGDKDEISFAWKALETTLKNEAKSISTKYICPPYSTNFAIMFLPFEGLYAEVTRHNLIEELQHDYNVNIAGPSTMAALLSSLQLGFKTLQIQKRSSEVWTVLSAVKTEFGNFEKVFQQAQQKIKRLDEDMEKLVGTRTRAIQRKLKDVETMDTITSNKILEIEGDVGEV